MAIAYALPPERRIRVVRAAAMEEMQLIAVERS
jgi:hypothetical protein